MAKHPAETVSRMLAALRALILKIRVWFRTLGPSRIIGRSRLFDADWYRAANQMAPTQDALRHYLAGPRDRRPSPWFDASWYLQTYPDVACNEIHPLVHYISFGWREGRNPNPSFATSWYLQRRPEAAAGPTPLDQYLASGVAQFDDPNPDFDAAWYAANFMQGDDRGLDPLGHFLLIGQQAGAPTQPAWRDSLGAPVELARLETFKSLGPADRRIVVLLTAQAVQGRLADWVRPFVEALNQAGAQVVLLVETDTVFTPEPDLVAGLAGGYVREARGYHYSAWAHLLRAEPLLFSGSALLLWDEALAARVEVAALSGFLRRVETSGADVLSPEDLGGVPGRLDGRLLALKARVLASAALHRFLGAWTCQEAGEAAIRTDFETRMALMFRSAGLRLEGLSEDSTPEALSLLGGPSRADDVGATPCGLAARSSATSAGLLPVHSIGAPQRPWKVAFIGPWNFATGLSQASRGYISALWRTDARLNLLPVETAFHVHTRVTPTLSVRDFEGAPDAVIVHLNPDAWGALTPLQRNVIDQARVRIGLWVWEMGHVPSAWRPEFDAVDEIWTPSRYCAEVFAAQTDRPVSVIPHVVPAPPPAERAGRSGVLHDLDLPADARIILYVFDGASYIERKNPQALVRAFAATDLAARGWRLVLKTKNLMDQPKAGAALAQLVAQTPGVSMVEKQLSQDALAALFEAADIFASPHRSEGFGLTVAEAMARGKSVVASDYGGVRDFLDSDCGFPVPVRTVQLGEELGAYPKGGFWGEVDEAAFAAALSDCARRLEAGDNQLGERARSRIGDLLSAQAVAGAMTSALEAALSRRASRVAAQ
ncbi:glycosyltransferase [Phenylobacterium sp. LjRoot225]|uniref:glycosyltransferase family 4 protein n=1 Tax=Phenylobacterium sp. LjRoot225 TaxID=3342285 RepID=UPI003ECC3EF3